MLYLAVVPQFVEEEEAEARASATEMVGESSLAAGEKACGQLAHAQSAEESVCSDK